MICKDSLSQLRDIDAKSLNANSLVDATSILIDPSASLAERFERFLELSNNPYAFICKGAIVKIGYINTQRTLEQSLAHFLVALNNS